MTWEVKEIAKKVLNTYATQLNNNAGRDLGTVF